jgi:hypothetical protein
MRNLLHCCIFIVLLVAGGCEDTGRFKDFLRPVPVKPLSGVIRTAVPIGNCAMLAMAEQMGATVPCEKITIGSGFSMLRITPDGEFPLVYLDASCREIRILRFSAGDDFAILSLFFIYDDPGPAGKKVLEVHTIPASIEDGIVRSVFASQDIYVRDNLELNLHMEPAIICFEQDRMESPEPETAEAAIGQNAWMIEVDPAGTWDLFADDAYRITGGEQDVSVLTGSTGNETSILQLAMIGTLMNPECIEAPVEGYALLHEIGVATGPEQSPEDLVMGTVLYRFDSPCSGQIFIPAATGNFITSTGKKVDLRLFD